MCLQTQKFNLTKDQAQNKSSKKFKRAIKYLEIANKYQPQEASIIFWQACVYEKAGYDVKSTDKMNQFMIMNNANYMSSIETVDINIK